MSQKNRSIQILSNTEHAEKMNDTFDKQVQDQFILTEFKFKVIEMKLH